MIEDKPPRRSEDEPSEIADASALFGDVPGAGGPSPGGPSPAPASDESYDLIDAPDEPVTPPPDDPGGPAFPVGGVGSRRTGKPKPTASRRDPEEAVDQVWSRWAEWGPNLVVIGLAGAAVLVSVYFLLGFEQYGLAFLTLFLGGAVVVVLGYPIFITLERPVRVIPEQAARDFYTALSHHVPHYRRMWLLLSRDGRLCTSYGSLEGFQNYWKARLAEIKGGRASASTPLRFVVEDFKSEKIAGQSELSATFTVKVLVRGKLGEGPIESFRVQTTLVKGPDRMWYLDRGTLP